MDDTYRYDNRKGNIAMILGHNVVDEKPNRNDRGDIGTN